MGVPDFQVITRADQSVTLPKSNGDIDHDISFPAPHVQSGSSSVLAFRVKPDGGKVKLKITLKGNSGPGKELGELEYDGVERSWHEVVPGGILSDRNNRLTLTKTGGPGKITVSDVVLFFQTTDEIPG